VSIQIIAGTYGVGMSIAPMIQARRMRQRCSSEDVSIAGELRSAGFEFLATAKRPHYTLRAQGGDTLDVERLLSNLGVPAP